MPAPIISALPTAPTRGSGGTTYTATADTWAAALPGWTTQANALATYLDGLALAATGTGNFTNITATGTVSAGGLTILPITPATTTTVSGTVVNYTGILSTVRRVTILFSGVSTSGTSAIIVKIGESGAGISSTGYDAASQTFISGSTAVPTSTTATTGFLIGVMDAADTLRGSMRIEELDASSNTWIATFTGTASGSGVVTTMFASGVKTLPGVLDRIRISTVGGTDTFDAGKINLIYE